MKRLRMVITLAVLLSALGGQWNGRLARATGVEATRAQRAGHPNSATPPTGYTPLTSPPQGSPPQQGEAKILLIQTAWPWASSVDVDVLNALGYTFNIVDMSSTGSVEIFSYPVVLIANDQVQAFYDSYAQKAQAFESYVRQGGTLVFFAASDGWAGGTLKTPLPGGVMVATPDYEARNYIAAPDHPLINGSLSDGMPLTDADLGGNYTSHGHFTRLVQNTVTLLRDDDGTPTLIEYKLGKGKVIASTNTWEFHYTRLAWGTWSQKALDDVFLYAFMGAALAQDDVRIALHVEDAPEGVLVNKTAGDAGGPAGATTLDLVAKLVSDNLLIANGLTVTLQVQDDLLGAPQEVYFRTLDGSEPGPIPFNSLGGGRYQAVTGLQGVGLKNYGQVVWRFAIPAGVKPQKVTATAELAVRDHPLRDGLSSGTINLVKNPANLIITNRHLLYEKYSDAQVTRLLELLYTVAQGAPRNDNPLGVVYDVAQYSPAARDWDENPTYPGTEASVNGVASAIDGLIEDWYSDATSYASVEFNSDPHSPPLITPAYLTIVGDDDVVPFYRYYDPSGDEQGWRVTNANNPAIKATDYNYLFTDDVYADGGGGVDWQVGLLELAAGRLVGDSAEEMRQLLAHGVDPSRQGSGRVVMASTDGWELGRVGQVGGGTPDPYNVPELFTERGFEVLNDSEAPVTIDTMAPYAWDTGDLQAVANGGMDLFFLGGHDSYNLAVLPGDDFSPDDTPGRYTRFDGNHPLALITGCHGGLSMPQAGGVGGAGDDMVRDLVYEGASGYIGASGFSYGTPNNLHSCTFGENLIQRYFYRLLLPGSAASQTIGEAMRQAKEAYVFGISGDDNIDRKTLAEYIVYGVPWQRLRYPAGGARPAGAQAPAEVLGASRLGTAGPIQAQAAGVYSRLIDINVPLYTHSTQDGFDLLSLPGGSLDYADGRPVVPYLEGYSMPLPYQAAVTRVEIMDQAYTRVGPFHLPAAQVAPNAAGGVTFGEPAAVNAFHPAELVTWQTGQGQVRFYIAPLQHNPATRETRFYSRLQVKVTYSAPLALSIANFQTDQAAYTPLQPVSVQGRIYNIGDTAANVSVRLYFTTPGGAVVPDAGETLPAIIPPGGFLDLQNKPVTLPPGAFNAVWEVLQGTQLLAWEEAPVSVVDARMTSFTYPEMLVSGALGIFKVQVSNDGAAALPVRAEVVLYDQQTGVEAARLLQQNATIQPGQTVTATWNWDSTNLPLGAYTAVAQAYSGSSTYGPLAGGVQVISGAPPNLSASTIKVDKARAKAGDILTYALSIKNTGVSTATQVLVENPIPWGTGYVSGSASASRGSISDSGDIQWTGDLAPGAAVSIVFQVRVEPVNGLTIQDQALVSDPSLPEPVVLSASTTIPVENRLYLPVMKKR